jgi:hypothetical protein
MSLLDTGGPAFPRTGYYPDTDECGGEALRERLPAITDPQQGMTLRDYFAAKAMTAEMITTFSDATPQAAETFAKNAKALRQTAEQHLAFNAYKIADAMLHARLRPTAT